MVVRASVDVSAHHSAPGIEFELIWRFWNSCLPRYQDAYKSYAKRESKFSSGCYKPA